MFSRLTIPFHIYRILFYPAYRLKVVFRMVLDCYTRTRFLKDTNVFPCFSELEGRNKRIYLTLSYELWVKCLFRLPLSFVQKHFLCKF